MGEQQGCVISVRKSLKRFLDKTLENLSSVKFYAVVIASLLLYTDKLSSEYWFYTIAVCIATRNLVEVLGVVKDIRLGKGPDAK